MRISTRSQLSILPSTLARLPAHVRPPRSVIFDSSANSNRIPAKTKGTTLKTTIKMDTHASVQKGGGICTARRTSPVSKKWHACGAALRHTGTYIHPKQSVFEPDNAKGSDESSFIVVI